ncbi:hypothetical protein LCGC14_0320300 [marine sediment metagenome]|uniref:Uncharacterized protein n=1 Tax=marine sediment metagenome TaxID=412755 RepID=A0A0F9U293_9ZZZZ
MATNNTGNYLNGAKAFPCESARYGVTAYADGAAFDLGQFDSIEAAQHESVAQIPSHYDRAVIYDRKRGHAIWKTN